MKQIIFFLLLLLPAAAKAQYSAAYVYYAIDSVSVDSFFLKTVSITGLGSPRQDTSYSYELFTDTTAFIAFVQTKYEELGTFGDRYLFLKQERDTLSNRYDRLVALGGSAESPFRNLAKPPGHQSKPAPAREPEPEPAKTGFWILRPGNRVEYLTEITAETPSGMILHPDGTKKKHTKAKTKK